MSEARLHRHELELAGKAEEEARERRILLSGLRAEIVSLHTTAGNYAQSHHQFALLYKAMHEHNSAPSMKEFVMAGYKAPFYNENISKVGLLRVSLAADIIRVYNGVFEDRKVAWEKPAPNSVVSIAYATGAVVAYKFQSDLQHVAMRIRAFEEDTPDPGSIYETQDKRHSSLPKLEEMVPAKLY